MKPKTLSFKFIRHLLLYVSLFTSYVMLQSTGCSPATPTIPCNTANTPFHQFYNSLTSNGLFEANSMDVLTHEYSFKVPFNTTICKVGYQGNPGLSPSSYTIEIVNGSTVLYTGTHVFATGSTDYQAITPVNLVPGQTYTIRRSVTNTTTSLANLVGRMVYAGGGSMSFPITIGQLTITGTNFYGKGGPLPNVGIPFIDIVFQ